MTKKIIVVAVVALFIIALLIWLFIESSKPLPGQKFDSEGRDHVDIGTKVDYKTNPPTSGDHYADWIKSGIYSEPKDDRNLIHSLEHGYVILSYKCKVQSEKSEEATESGEVDQDCSQRKDQLAKVYEEKGKRKLIVVPRENLDTNFVLTAWNYLDKFNDFDQQRIERFIDVHLNQGPEKTMEQ